MRDVAEVTQAPVRMPTCAFLIFLHFFAILWGIHSGATSGTASPIDMLFPLVAGVVVVWACANDARMRGKPFLGMMAFLMLVVWPIAAPLYLISSRGWRGILWAMLWIVTLVSCFLFPAAFVMMVRSGK